MSRKNAGGKCCPAGKVKPRHSDPVVAQVAAMLAVAKAQKGGRWKLSDATAANRRVIIGAGNLGAKLPGSLAPWEQSIGGKPRTKAQKRAAKRAKLEAKGRAENANR